MLKFRFYIYRYIYRFGLVGLVSCLAITGCRFVMPKPDYTDKAISYLRSQLNITEPIVIESQEPLAVNVKDPCQTIFPTQEGWQISLISTDTRYIVQANQTLSQIEICRSEDSQAETSKKYVGAGFELRYPIDWQVSDFGLEPAGENVVIFTPDRTIIQSVQLEEDILATKRKIQQKLEQGSQPYLMVLRQPQQSRNTQDKAIAQAGETKKSRVFSDANFIYTVSSYDPAGSSSAILEKSMGSFILLTPIR